MGAFTQLVAKLESKGTPAGEANAIAYKHGVKKYGKTAMAKGAAAGKPAKNFAGKGK